MCVIVHFFYILLG